MKLSITYQIVTPESAEQGDVEESGFALEDSECMDVEEVQSEIAFHTGSFQGFEASNSGAVASSTYWSTVDGEEDYETGALKFYAVHLSDASLEERQALNVLLTR
jgi:hypothetical protein